MKFLLKILYAFVIIIAIILLAGIFMPKEAHLESSIKIYAKPEIVFEQVNTLKSWEKWSPWYKADTSMVMTYNEVPSGVGAKYSWISDNSGSGSMEITESRPNEFIRVLLKFEGEGSAYAPWTFIDNGNSTSVKWGFDSHDLKYFERYFMVLFKNVLVESFNKGLKDLKAECESFRLSRFSDIQLVNLEKRHSVVITDSASVSDIPQKMAEMFGALQTYVQKKNIVITGYPFTIYYKWVPGGVSTFAVGFPVEKKIWTYGKIKYIEMQEGKAAMVTHWGRYDSKKPHTAISEFIGENNLELNGNPWEEYLNNPEEVKDTSEWKMNVYYPVN
ncbi:MAG: SRPBCC family protein [Bacteroidales bacterium]|nr:SRPBCC family protein [Bacteroidales bacterium]